MNYITINNNQFDYRQQNSGFLSYDQVDSNGSQIVYYDNNLTTKSYEIFTSNINNIQPTQEFTNIINTNLNTIPNMLIYVLLNGVYDVDINTVTSDSSVTFDVSGNQVSYNVLPQNTTSIMLFRPIWINKNTTQFFIRIKSNCEGIFKVNNFKILMLTP